MEAIDVHHLTRRFGSLVAVNDVSFQVKEGEFFGYLGPNGAGKTTTIRILTGITTPNSGSASIFGHDIQTETIRARRHMGIVPETSNIYDDLSAWKNMMFSGELYGVGFTERTERAKELLTIFGLYERKDDRVFGFSRGMKRRLTIGMGLINKPRLLFLDEPTSGLDVQSNLIIRQVLRDLHDKGVTIFLTTHNIEEANVLCERVAIINRGIIAAIDAPEKLKGAIQSVQSIEIGFDHPVPGMMGALQALPLVNEVRREGDKVRIFTSYPGDVLLAVMVYLQEKKIKPLSVNTHGPSLEDVFIKLTGLEDTGTDQE
ncbi:MAG: ATP-binding cassette domain-containing protein, partial [Methanomicrobiales archaeon]|nr:ATP-binding cassette domain-containing protein [Methanomicrobiales archaeon]